MVRTYQAEAVITRVVKTRETDSRLTAVSHRHGKIVVVARGLRKINSRRAPFLDLFSHGKLFLAKGKTFDVVTDIVPFNNYIHLKSDLTVVAACYKMAEVVNTLLPEREPHPEVFQRFLADLVKMDNSVKKASFKKNNLPAAYSLEIADSFGLFLLWQLGYLPRDRHLKGKKLDSFLEETMERRLKSSKLLTKLL